MTDHIEDPILIRLVKQANMNGQLESLSHRFERPEYRAMDIAMLPNEVEYEHRDNVPEVIHLAVTR